MPDTRTRSSSPLEHLTTGVGQGDPIVERKIARSPVCREERHRRTQQRADMDQERRVAHEDRRFALMVRLHVDVAHPIDAGRNGVERLLLGARQAAIDRRELLEVTPERPFEMRQHGDARQDLEDPRWIGRAKGGPAITRRAPFGGRHFAPALEKDREALRRQRAQIVVVLTALIRGVPSSGTRSRICSRWSWS